MSGDWFRNERWDDSIEAAFFKRLARSRQKSQYLRIQAHGLAASYPHAALRLLDRYFELDDNLMHSSAYCTRAIAQAQLNLVAEAIASYQAALQCEIERPSVQSQAHIELPALIVRRHMVEHFPMALDILERHRHRPVLAVEHFRWNALSAIISDAQGQRAEARERAKEALRAAALTASFSKQDDLGLVGPPDKNLLSDAQRIADKHH